MNPETVRRMLIVISSDPRKSGRPAEAIRIAAGLAGARTVSLQVLLRGPAVQILEEHTDLLLDDRQFEAHLPLLAREIREFLVDQETQPPSGKFHHPVRRLSEPDLQTLFDSIDYAASF